ncbi:TetR/AcrR family transcriptional regulator [Microbacterium sp. NPDC058345]|uniref:TetR/AcrR family transcriptional regulator n=1 Tax=Microbacterium sp. NPDC058345 TaxID=3346455 RepID=UPI0036686726
MAHENRRARIADAVIATLAREGSRGLTHRAVDAAAQLPSGSTSYYLRNRAALLTAAVQRLVEADAAKLEAIDPRHPVAAITAVMEQALTGEGRLRTVARYELSLESARRPELREALSAGTSTLERLIVDRFGTTLPLAEATQRARDLLAVIDGVLFAEVTGANPTPRTSDEIRGVVEWALERLEAGTRSAHR